MKRSKASLVVMEQLAMLLVFALAAAVCLRVFAYSDRLSRRIQDRDRACELSQNVAEVLRHTAGDFPRAAELLDAALFDEAHLALNYDADWQADDADPHYVLGAARVASPVPGLGRGQVWVQDVVRCEELFRLEIAWQEVVERGA